MTKEEWLAQFEIENGRKPTPSEFVAARENGSFTINDDSKPFLNGFSEKVSGLGTSVTQKTKVFARNAQATAQIAKETKKLDSYFKDLGEYFYEKYKDTPIEECKYLFDKIKKSEELIKKQEKIKNELYLLDETEEKENEC